MLRASSEIRRTGGAAAFEDRPDSSLVARHKALLVTLLVAHGLLAWQLRARGIFTFGDDAAYLLLSRSVKALSYREFQFVGNPVAARFPPGYPAFLAMLTAPAGERLSVVSVAGILMSMAGLAFLFDVVRRRWSTELALLATAATAVNPVLLTNAGSVTSETLYTTLTLASLWAADRAERARAPRPPGARAALAAGGLAIGAALTRSAGVTMLAALGIHWLQRRRYHWVFVFGVVATVTVGAWLTWTVVAPGRQVRRSYVDDAVNVRGGDGSLQSTLLQRVERNVSIYVGQAILTELSLPVTPRSRMDNVAWVALLGSLLAAGLVSAWGRWNAVVWYLGAYSGLLAVWAYTLERFLDPLLPALIALIVVGAGVVSTALSRKARWLPPAVVTMTLAWFALGEDARLVGRAADCDRSRVDCATPRALDYLDAVAYLGSHSSPDARVVAPKAPTLYYHSKRQALYWDEIITQAPDSFDGLLRRARVSYILTTPVFSDHITLLRLAYRDCARLDLVRAFSPQTLLLAVRPEDAPPVPEGRACAALDRAEKLAANMTDRG